MPQALSTLRKGDSGKIVSIDSYELQLSLMRLGLVPGERFQLSTIAPFGDPIALNVGETKIAIRKQDAAKVQVELIA